MKMPHKTKINRMRASTEAEHRRQRRLRQSDSDGNELESIFAVIG